MERHNSVKYCPTSWNTLASTLTYLLFLLASHATTSTAARVSIPFAGATNTNFIATSCANARYQQLCLSSLSPYATTIQSSPTQLVRIALSLGLASARSASDTVRKMSAGRAGPKLGDMAPAVSDCLLTMGDAVSQLQRSMDAMGRFGGPGSRRQVGDVLTWVSTALTEEQSCMDWVNGSAMDGAVKVKARGQVERAVQHTSNALSFVSTLASKVSGKKGRP